MAHQFCYRFYGGRLGSFPVEWDCQMVDKYPERKGPFSHSPLVAEAAFDPFVHQQGSGGEGPADLRRHRC